MSLETSIRARIAELLELKADGEAYDVVGEVYAGTLTIAAQLYGNSSRQVEAVAQLRRDLNESKWTQDAKTGFLVRQCHGILKSFASDLDGGRLQSLRLEFQGQVFADFVTGAKAAVASGSKDVGAVLACAALEDALKRYAEAKGLDIEDAEMASVTNALKSAGLLTAPEGALLKGMVALRNKALHAEWSKVDEASVHGVIAFVEEFLIRRFK